MSSGFIEAGLVFTFGDLVPVAVVEAFDHVVPDAGFSGSVTGIGKIAGVDPHRVDLGRRGKLHRQGRRDPLKNHRGAVIATSGIYARRRIL